MGNREPKRPKIAEKKVEGSRPEAERAAKPRKQRKVKRSKRQVRWPRPEPALGHGQAGNQRSTQRYESVSLRNSEINEIAMFKDAKAWKEESKTKLFPRLKEDRTNNAPGIKEIRFNQDFDIKDVHLDDIIAKGRFFCHSLCSISLGDSDTGKGSSLSDAAVIRLAQACPNLSLIRLESCVNLTDASLIGILERVKWIQLIAISGNDKVKGRVRGPALEELRQRPEWGTGLVELELSDQRESKEFRKAVKGLKKSRTGLKINAIQSESDSAMFWNSCMPGSFPYADDDVSDSAMFWNSCMPGSFPFAGDFDFDF